MPLKLLPSSKVVAIRNGPARGLKWIVGSSNHGCWLGTFELESQRVFESIVRPGVTVYDVGANAGFFTLFFSRLTGPRGRVIAFEPCPYEMRYLLEHLRMNALENVLAFEVAVTDQTGLSGFSYGRARSQNTLVSSTESSLQVATVTLDAFAEGMPPPDFIKIDVEGAEASVLRGAAELLRKRRPALFLELHGDDQVHMQWHTCVDQLRSANYEIYDLSGRTINGKLDQFRIYALPRGTHTVL
jgi:FkbM family methyltransferase